MKIKAIGMALILGLSCLLATGCAGGGQTTTKPEAAKPATKQETTATTTTAGSKEKTIYVLPDDGSQSLVLKKVKIKAEQGQEELAVLQAVVENNAKSFPKGTKVLGLIVKDGLATVNLSKEFLTKGQGEYERTMSLYAIVNSLTEASTVKKVLFQAEGKKIEVLGQMDLEGPLTRNQTYLPKNK